MDKIKMWETLKIVRLVCIGIGILGILFILIHSFWKGEKERARTRWKRDKRGGFLSWLPFKKRQHKLLNLDKLVRPSESASDPEKQKDTLNVVGTNDPFEAIQPKTSSVDSKEANRAYGDQVEHEETQPSFVSSTPNASSMPTSATKRAPAPKPCTLVVLHISALPGAHFSRAALLHAFKSVGLTYGERDIYHQFIARNEETAKLFSVANLVKPGSLPLEQKQDFTTTGLTLFMQLHTVHSEVLASALTTGAYLEGIQVFETMLDVARSLARLLKGVVLDEQRKLLTPTKVTALGRLLQSKKLYVHAFRSEEDT